MVASHSFDHESFSLEYRHHFRDDWSEMICHNIIYSHIFNNLTQAEDFNTSLFAFFYERSNTGDQQAAADA